MSARAISEASGKRLLNQHLGAASGAAQCRYGGLVQWVPLGPAKYNVICVLVLVVLHCVNKVQIIYVLGNPKIFCVYEE